MTGTTINVTAEHIRTGKAGDNCFCPIALALRDTFPDVETIHVHFATAYITTSGISSEVILPQEANDFIEAFDFGNNRAEPFSFTLDYPAVTP
jgi:hypothetical protein